MLPRIKERLWSVDHMLMYYVAPNPARFGTHSALQQVLSLGVVYNKVNNIPHCVHLLHSFVRHLYSKLFLNSHHNFNGIKAIGSKIFKRRRVDHFDSVNAK